MLDSKKWKAALTAACIAFVAALLQQFGVAVTQEQLLTVLAPFLVYILGQGISDVGKGRAEALALDVATVTKLRHLSSKAKKPEE